MVGKVKKMYFKGLSQEKISKRLRVSRYEVSEIIKKYKIKKNTRNKKHERVVKLYLRGIPAIKIAELTNYSTTNISAILNKYNVKTYKNKRRKLNQDFFKKIDTPQKAYWLGFLYADGNLSSSNNNVYDISIRLSISDINQLEKFKTDLDSDDVIATGEQDSFGTKTSYCCIYISSKKMYEDLIKLGCTPRKSNKLKFPTPEQVPRHLVFHFIRGYFDGDGSLSHTHRNRRRLYTLSFSGNRDFLTEVRDILNTNNKIIYYPHKNSSLYQIGGNQQLKRILYKIYYNADVYLERKHDLYLEYKRYMEVDR